MSIGSGSIGEGSIGEAGSSRIFSFFTLHPDVVVSESNLQDSLLNDPPTQLSDLDSVDAAWWTAVVVTQPTLAHFGFPTPSVPPKSGVGLQKVRIRVRRQ